MVTKMYLRKELDAIDKVIDNFKSRIEECSEFLKQLEEGGKNGK